MPIVGFDLLFKENIRGTGSSGIVQRYHNFSVLGVVREGIQALLVIHRNIGDPDAGGIVEAWQDF